MNDLIIVLGIPLIRNVAGWAENALKDKKITKYEWQKLAETVVKLGVPGLLLYYGIDMPPEMAGSLPALVDYVFSLFANKVGK